MKISQNIRKAYSEVDEIIELIDKETREKIPHKVRKLFKEEKDKEYIKSIDPNIPIKQQKLKEDTLAIIAYLNLKYICEDESEKERLINTYINNENKYQEAMQIDFNADNVFKKETIVENKNVNLKNPMIVKKEPFLKKILNIIKKILKNNYR